MGRDRYAVKKLAQGYRAPYEREGCHSCAHGRVPPIAFSERPYMNCAKGGFIASPLGMCPQHQPAGVAVPAKAIE